MRYIYLSNLSSSAAASFDSALGFTVQLSHPASSFHLAWTSHGQLWRSSGGICRSFSMWWSLRLLWVGRWNGGSREHLCDKELGLLVRRWWWSHQPGSGTSCLPARVTWDKVLGLSWPPLFCNTGDISLLLPTREGPLGSSEQPGSCHSQPDFSMLTLEGMCPKLGGEDMPAALPTQGM